MNMNLEMALDLMFKWNLETETTLHFSCAAGCILLLEQNYWTIYILLLHVLRIALMKNI